jgi:chromosome partitioning protein
VLRESQVYVRCIEKGLTLFDLPALQVQADLAQWEPILQWLQPIVHPVARAVEDAPRAAPSPGLLQRVPTGIAAARAPMHVNSTTNPPRLPVESPPRAVPRQASSASPMSRLLDALPIPRFLQRTP